MYALQVISLLSAMLQNQCCHLIEIASFTGYISLQCCRGCQHMSAQKLPLSLWVCLWWHMIYVCITGHISLQCCLVEPVPPAYERSEDSISSMCFPTMTDDKCMHYRPYLSPVLPRWTGAANIWAVRGFLISMSLPRIDDKCMQHRPYLSSRLFLLWTFKASATIFRGVFKPGGTNWNIGPTRIT